MLSIPPSSGIYFSAYLYCAHSSTNDSIVKNTWFPARTLPSSRLGTIKRYAKLPSTHYCMARNSSNSTVMRRPNWNRWRTCLYGGTGYWTSGAGSGFWIEELLTPEDQQDTCGESEPLQVAWESTSPRIWYGPHTQTTCKKGKETPLPLQTANSKPKTFNSGALKCILKESITSWYENYSAKRPTESGGLNWSYHRIYTPKSGIYSPKSARFIHQKCRTRAGRIMKGPQHPSNRQLRASIQIPLSPLTSLYPLPSLAHCPLWILLFLCTFAYLQYFDWLIC